MIVCAAVVDLSSAPGLKSFLERNLRVSIWQVTIISTFQRWYRAKEIAGIAGVLAVIKRDVLLNGI